MKLNLVLVLNVLYLALIAALTFLNWLGPDRFWMAALNFYLPQVIWTFPGILLAAVTLLYARLWALVPLAGVLWVLWPIMDWHWSWQPRAAVASGPALRVMTWNIKYGNSDLMPLIAELQRNRPDILLFQDAPKAANGPLSAHLAGFQVVNHGQYVLASRYPIRSVELYELPWYEEKGESFLRCQVRVGSRDISIYNVHFKSPRWSLKAFRKASSGAWYFNTAIDGLEQNMETRILQAERVAEFLGQEKGDCIVAGDFNAPDHSLVCEILKSAGLADAFSLSGRGYGYTYGHNVLKNRVPLLRASWMRIDHIMTTSGLKAQRCWVGTRKASDHRPVTAEFVLATPRQSVQ